MFWGNLNFCGVKSISRTWYSTVQMLLNAGFVENTSSIECVERHLKRKPLRTLGCDQKLLAVNKETRHYP